MNKLKRLMLTLSLALGLVMPVAAVGATYAANVNIGDNLCGGTDLQISSSGTDCGKNSQAAQTKVNTLITNIVNIFSAVVGFIAVIMIVVGGFRYITSGGVSDKVTSAKSTILYAIIGLIVIALAQLIVKFVVSKATSVS